MKIQAARPARAAWAATEFARLPVEAADGVEVEPDGGVEATATTRSLNDSGWETSARRTPSARASAGASMSGVNPVSSDTTGSPRIGSHSR